MPNAYNININVKKYSDTDPNKEDLIKKVDVIIKYKIGNKTYEESAQRLKIKE